MKTIKHIRNISFAGLMIMFLVGCVHPPKYSNMTIACDSSGNPVFVTTNEDQK